MIVGFNPKPRPHPRLCNRRVSVKLVFCHEHELCVAPIEDGYFNLSVELQYLCYFTSTINALQRMHLLELTMS